MLKDLTLALSAATDAKLKLILGEQVLLNYRKLVENDQGNLDFSNIVN